MGNFLCGVEGTESETYGTSTAEPGVPLENESVG